MSAIAVELEGTLQKDEAELRAALVAIEADPPPVLEEHGGALYLTLHPAAEPVSFELDGRGVRARASTGTAGPGYHRHVCGLLRGLPVAWGAARDDAGYWDHGDGAALEEVFVDWFGAAAAQIHELTQEGVAKLAFGLDGQHRFTHDEPLATALGPRDHAWLRRARDDAAEATDVFAWWSPARDAAFYRRLALCLMWTEVRWRPPITDEERALLERVATYVEKSHGLDPEGPLPWAEQAELLGYLEEDSLRATRARMKADALGGAPRIGYRRRPVRARLSGGWSLEIDGAFAERWEERGTWVAWDETRSVWFTSMHVEGAPGAAVPSTRETLAGLPPLEGDEILELEAGELRGLASFSEEERDGETVFRLEAHAALGPHAAVGTLVFVEPADRQWAMSTWGSLYRQASGGDADG